MHSRRNGRKGVMTKYVPSSSLWFSKLDWRGPKGPPLHSHLSEPFVSPWRKSNVFFEKKNKYDVLGLTRAVQNDCRLIDCKWQEWVCGDRSENVTIVNWDVGVVKCKAQAWRNKSARFLFSLCLSLTHTDAHTDWVFHYICCKKERWSCSGSYVATYKNVRMELVWRITETKSHTHRQALWSPAVFVDINVIVGRRRRRTFVVYFFQCYIFHTACKFSFMYSPTRRVKDDDNVRWNPDFCHMIWSNCFVGMMRLG